MSEADSEARGRFSRWWWLPDWLWEGTVILILGWIASIIKRRILKIGVKRTLSKIASYTLRSLPLIIPMSLGFVFMEQYIAYFDTTRVLSIGFVFVGVLACLEIIFRRRAKHNLLEAHRVNVLNSGLFRGVAIGFNFLIGAFLKIFYILTVGLAPYVLAYPGLFAVFGVYGLLIFCLVLMKRTFGRLGGRRTHLPRGLWV